MVPSHARRWVCPVASVLLLFGVTLPTWAQGLVLPAVGPVNQSMGGASVAAPLDATGALYWNPASLSGLPQSQVDFGTQILFVNTDVSSTVNAGTFGPGTPGTTLSGSTQSRNGIAPLPTFGLSYRPDNSLLTFGLGVFTIGGFGVNYPADPSNPILSPRPPNGFGLGSVYSELAILELAPAVSLQLTDQLSIGVGPTITLARLAADPAPYASPDDANGDGSATFPSSTHTRFHWGADSKRASTSTRATAGISVLPFGVRNGLKPSVRRA